MKKEILVGLVLLIAGAFGMAFAQQGPNTATFADVTATACAASTPVAANQTAVLAVSSAAGGGIASRLCFTLNNMSTTIAARCGDSVGTNQGVVLNAVPAAVATGDGGGSWSACTTTAINCCGIGGSTTIGGAAYNR